MARALTRLTVVAAALACALPSGAPARPAPAAELGDRRSAARTVLLGVLGNPDRFDALTGQRTAVGHVIVGWSQGHRWGTPFPQLFSTLGDVPMIGIHTSGRLSPRDVALGRGDDYLVALNQAVAEWPGRIYIRPFGEMNGHWNDYSAYNRNGTPRGPSHSTAIFRKAFARVYLIVHGGPQVAGRLRRLGLPPVAAELAPNPLPRVRVIWNPQGYGSPDIPGNRAAAYYPGDGYVDVVGNDLYNIRGKAEWEANERLYAAHPTKPYAIPEWGNWGIDDPDFVRRMATFVRTHRRVELVSYYNGKPGSVWDLGTKPRSRSAYRRAIVPLGR